MSNPQPERRLLHVDPMLDQSMDHLFAAHYAPLCRALYRVTGDTAAAEELASEAFWRLHQSGPPPPENPPGWLYRTGMRLGLDWLRRRKRRTHYESLAPPPAGEASPETALEQERQRHQVREALAQLKPEQAALLILRAEGHTLAEAAQLLSLHPNSVGVMLSRAGKAFRKEYVERYGE